MGWYELLQPLVFRADAETAHEWALRLMTQGIVKGTGPVDAPLACFGVEFPNPVGLAAGFDKNALGLAVWRSFGFGFVEIGTVTRYAQPGNPKPRMFRLPADRALINRLGFNNDGADVVAHRLENRPTDLVVGANIGKSKKTELADAPEDYAYSYKRLAPLADYVTVNVSSPNTPGLRTLQDRDPLAKILWRLKEIDGNKPLLVKIAPDLSNEQVDDVAALADEFELAGIVATNTTISRAGLTEDPNQEGGLSGAPLAVRSTEVLLRLREALPGKAIISVGGIMSPAMAQERLQQGADLVQTYTGWIYGGPDFPARLAKACAES